MSKSHQSAGKYCFLFSLLVLLVSIVHFYSNLLQLIWYIVITTVLFCLSFIKNRKFINFCKKANYISTPVTIVWLILLVLWENIFTYTSYGKYDIPTFNTAAALYTGKTLILVPHQDDESILSGGIIDEIKKRGEVYVLFSTDGRHGFRSKEAIRALARYGIPHENIIFMGFPDFGRTNATHMYNSRHDEVLTGTQGATKSWGIPGINCYKPGTPYTRRHFISNLTSLIKTIKPDTFICIDYDSHRDHRALSLSFDECMCSILREDIHYKPLILKGFAYSPIWHKQADFYNDNIPGTKMPYTGQYMEEVFCYTWSDRIRIPVGSKSLTRVLTGNLAREAFAEHQSQNQVPDNEEKIPKGDRVFWWRPTGNMLIHSTVTGTGINPEHLNDFKLYDSNDVNNSTAKPLIHGWIPPATNAVATFHLDTPSTIRQIRLYDQVNIENQVRELTIRLSNGKELYVRNLPANGSPLIVNTESNDILTGFELHIKNTTGQHAGLAEVEAYENTPNLPGNIVKLQDKNEDFMYDYIVPENGHVDFSIYSTINQQYKVFLQRHHTAHELQKNRHNFYSIDLKPGENCIITVTDKAGNIVDAARIKNPEWLTRQIYRTMQKADAFMRCRTFKSRYRFLRFLIDAAREQYTRSFSLNPFNI